MSEGSYTWVSEGSGLTEGSYTEGSYTWVSEGSGLTEGSYTGAGTDIP